MADILIRGMENIPVGQEFVVVENIDFERYLYNRETGAAFHLVPLPEGHGKLVDAREVLEKADKAPWYDGDVSELGLLLGSEVTTIVPADATDNYVGSKSEGGTDNG